MAGAPPVCKKINGGDNGRESLPVAICVKNDGILQNSVVRGLNGRFAVSVLH